VTTTPDPTKVIDVPETSSTPVPTKLTADPVETSTPIPPTESTESTPETSEQTVDAVETETPLLTDQTELMAEPVTAEEVIEEPTVAEILQEIPEGTDLVVLDENGEPEPLATQDAAEIVATGDPIWCPDGIDPTPDANGCSESFNTLSELVSAMEGTVTQNGTIWITSGPVTDNNPIILDDCIFMSVMDCVIPATWQNYSLTLQGGWSGNPGDTNIGANSEFSVPITITNWNGNVTLDNITVNDSSSRSSINTTDNVTVTDSTFSGRNGGGLLVNAADITIEDVTASQNDGVGLELHSGGNISLSGRNIFNDNGVGYNAGGLHAWAAGAITVDGAITANGNGRHGVYLNGVESVTLSGTNNFGQNTNSGLYIDSSGAVTLSGTNLFNGNMNAGLIVGSSGDVILSGTNNFSENVHAGLHMVSNGNVTLDNITVNGGSGSAINTTGDVTVMDSTFNESAGVGLYVWTAGDITLTNVTANGNADGGLWLKNDYGSNVTITNSTLTNNGYGLHVQAGGNLVLNNVNASNNTSTSTEHLNWWSGVLAYAPGNIIINGGSYSNNTSYGIYIRTPAEIELTGVQANGNMTGLFVEYSGTVDLTGVEASDNRQVGVDIRDTDTVTINGGIFTGNQTGLNVVSNGNVTLDNITVNDSSSRSSINTTGDVTVTDSTFSESNGGGLLVNAADITIEDVTASQNDGVGLELHSGGNISLSGGNIFNDNGVGYNAGGLHAWAAGAITVDGNITANGNGRHGVYLNGVESVTLIGTNNFEQNTNSGLFVDSSGAVTLSGTNLFNGNMNAGLIVSSNGHVTLSGTNLFNGNMTGLFVPHSGNVDLIGVQASNNQVGVDIRETGTVNITGGSITENGIGLNVKCVQSITFDPSQETIVYGNTTDLIIDPSCPVKLIDKVIPSFITSRGQGEFELNCIGQSGFAVNLPNGDLVNIFCPVSGKARIYRVDNTTLPAELPAGYTYASAYTLDIIQNNVSIPVITEGGYIKASFVAQPLQPGNTYSVLFWDKENSVWVPLKDFLLDENGAPRSFVLFPGTPDDTRMIISGVRIDPTNGRVEVSTNFPGIFVLAQH
jgi:hypothetical protein